MPDNEGLNYFPEKGFISLYLLRNLNAIFHEAKVTKRIRFDKTIQILSKRIQ